MNSGYSPQIDTAAMLNSQWMNPSASVAQPVSTPAFQMSPMNSFSGDSFNWGGAQQSANPFSMGGMNGQTPTGVTPTQGWGQKAASWLGDGQNLGTVVQGLGSLTQAYLGFKQLSMAKDQLKFSKEAFGKNFANSQQTYNTSLEDRIRGRSANPNEGDVQAYLAKHKLQQKP